MASASSLKDVYIEEMRDLWSANDQMQRVMPSLSEKASDATLKEMLSKSVDGIGRHTAALRALLEAQGGQVDKDHCKGMEGGSVKNLGRYAASWIAGWPNRPSSTAVLT